MFRSLKRLQLQRRGLMTEKTRRKPSEREWVELLRESPVLRGGLLATFAAVLVALCVGADVERGAFLSAPWRAGGVALLVFLAGLLHFYVSHPASFRRNSRLVLVFGAMLVQLALFRLIAGLASTGAFGEGGERYGFLLAPYALAPMAITILLGRNQGMFVAVLCAMWGGLLQGAAFALPVAITALVVGFVAVLVSDGLRRRSRLVRAGVLVGLTVNLFGLMFAQIAGAGPPSIDWPQIGYGTAAALAGGVVTAILIGGLLPVFESAFRVTTDISWIELADLNHPLLKRLTLEAPGTYHHSLVVANLAEAAADAVGANGSMCRVCSYFHDIGKLVKPGYFIENIGEGDNPHDDLTPTMSALVITAHVKEGVDLAIKNKLNSAIIDVIEQHHGTSLVYFFYRRALEQQEEMQQRADEGESNPDDVPEVSEKSFRYPGPKPQFKESGIISLADAVESASRSLQKPTPRKIRQLIDDIVNARIRDGQLTDCDLTLRELAAVAESFNTTLRSMLHSRISYPKDESGMEKKSAKKKQGKGKSTVALSARGGKKTGALLP